ncbi:S-adenosylmethionine decarboxylase proenzyme, prokaryotic class 1B [hydrothermal vent metagenome]|uniref:S-adenosylmethionine decarboxylase proenzyme, prokaryotic class 1B n=1 Tax=hydrothermal vent metagenome TaxID=652676 RepID=A0A3B0XH01_9ZZZZ
MKSYINNSRSAEIESEAESTADHFIVRDGVEYSGTHLIIDLWGASLLTDIEYIENVLRECVSICEATLLHIHLHQFSSSGGISGVAVLAESHISFHTWPERSYAAFDVFMCGSAYPLRAINVLKDAFRPEKLDVNEILRGEVRP